MQGGAGEGQNGRQVLATWRLLASLTEQPTGLEAVNEEELIRQAKPGVAGVQDSWNLAVWGEKVEQPVWRWVGSYM